ncbi:HD domain-containing phosphohydrolase [Aliivibrio fischeri]|uniref:HD domain-containing phosphohydrolase n=1 Tax=Aliivibrio fischeri TaxID=668 RepID=UPI00080DD50C|nr:HD domain-containing phosphohydrolase [Aliivibrio fischeri]OCH05087.1 metal-dependent phosphohydrolase [Aliivibrio fischeri]OCH39354.1 metal-dependent phosphohydrolase [Aliivibrio fischeri]OCH59848.1 metal-dependent phosphohydrolase [Aliivibrio fischeri]OED56837.1 metal-dependent phosphohydrolase [Aliivibrio fischeri]USR97259.1 HD domain-containing protein [Aliivibrio fischeri ATCC 7744 = JCM 18803 = DSM 507]
MRHYLSLVCGFVFLFAPMSLLAHEMKPLNILVLHSYSPSYEWTMNIQQGISESIAKVDRNVRLSVEYMDSKRVNGNDYKAQYLTYLKHKYSEGYFDAIIASDDNALNFLIKNANTTFPKLPIVAVGINNLSIDLADIEDRTTVYYERDHIVKNLKLSQSLFPERKTVYLFSDNSLTSQLVRKQFIEDAKVFPNLTVKIIDDLSLKEAELFLAKAGDDSVAFLTHFNTELKKGNYYDYGAIASVLSKKSNIPIFVFWEHYIGYGVLGGYVNRSYALGIQSILSLSNKLHFTVNEKVSAYPVAWEGYVFDYGIVDKFNIDRDDLPYASSIVNEPESFLYKNRNIISVTALLIIMMLGIIVTQYIAILRKKELDENKTHILKLQKKTLNVQKEMINVLGEAIETRSGETGNHVKRVAKMSSLLGRLYELPKSEYKLLEVISPMHDVGKIGIPEAILDKPGKLTPEERTIIETHTIMGYKLLMSGDGEIMQSAARIALEHHERWDGKGYPNQLKGEEIHIFARITAIVDVFDALMSKRCYKEAWPLERVIELFKQERGRQFDPNLSQLFLDNIYSFIDIRLEYPD